MFAFAMEEMSGRQHLDGHIWPANAAIDERGMAKQGRPKPRGDGDMEPQVHRAISQYLLAKGV